MTILIDADGCPGVSDVMKNKTSSRTLPLIRLNLRPLAEMVDILPRTKQQQRVAFADFSAAPWQGFKKSERCPNNSSLFLPQAAVVVVALGWLLAACGPPPCSHPHHLCRKKGTGLSRCLLLAEMVGFEPTCPIKDKTISSRSRYDRFDTSPYS